MADFFGSLTILEWIYLALFCSGLLYALFLAVFGLGHGAGHGVAVEHGADLGHGIDLGHGAGLGHGIDLGHGADLGHGIDVGHGADLGHGIDLGHGADLGHGIDLGHGADLGHGVEGHTAAVHAGEAHGDTGHGAEHGEALPVVPWNPIVIATLVGGLGGFGLLGTRLFGLLPFLSLLVALPAGVAMAAGVYFLYVLLVKQAGPSSAATWQELRGTPARVLTPIPEKGLGEVVYEIRGSRYTAPARTIDGRAIARGTSVTILDRQNGTMIVDMRYID